VGTSALDGDERSASRLGRFNPGENYYLGIWVGHSAGLEAVVKKQTPVHAGNRPDSLVTILFEEDLRPTSSCRDPYVSKRAAVLYGSDDYREKLTKGSDDGV
jgi:hypothetical protein